MFFTSGESGCYFRKGGRERGREGAGWAGVGGGREIGRSRAISTLLWTFEGPGREAGRGRSRGKRQGGGQGGGGRDRNKLFSFKADHGKSSHKHVSISNVGHLHLELTGFEADSD